MPPNLSTLATWALALAALIVGYRTYGWPGVVLAITMVVFWMLLQFNRSVRVLKDAGSNPIGQVASAVMLHSKLQTGMRLPQVLKLTRSLGRRIDEGEGSSGALERYVWTDAGGDSVQVELRDGSVTRWELQRAASVESAATQETP